MQTIFLALAIIFLIVGCVGFFYLAQSDAIEDGIRETTDTLSRGLEKLLSVCAVGLAVIFAGIVLWICAHSSKPAAQGYAMTQFGKELPNVMSRGQGIEAPGPYRVLPAGMGKAFPTGYDQRGRPISWQIESPNTISGHGIQGGPRNLIERGRDV